MGLIGKIEIVPFPVCSWLALEVRLCPARSASPRDGPFDYAQGRLLRPSLHKLA
jgi:hypothetical protein